MNNDTTIATLFKSKGKPLLSYEFFPPKTEKGIQQLYEVGEKLAQTKPDFVTITYGAGGSTREKTLDIARHLRNSGLSPVMPHLTCVGSSRAELQEIASEIYSSGFRNIMTLRGDPPKGSNQFSPPPDGLHNARELVTFLKSQHPDLCCGVAGYPETHPEAKSATEEMTYLKSKVDAGADFITTQLFFDNDYYTQFVSRCRDAGISCPILPGLMPAISLDQVKRFTSFCGAHLPEELVQRLEDAGKEGPEAEQCGLEWCKNQATSLLEAGAPGIHFYVLNKSLIVDDPSFHDVLLSI